MNAASPSSSSSHPLANRTAVIGLGFALFALGALATALVLEGPTAHSEPVPPRPLVQTAAADDAKAAKKEADAASAKPAAATAAGKAPVRTAAAACAGCGTVETVTARQREGETTGVGAVAGSVIGGVVGHQIGGGNGRKAMAVIGAVGGGVAGHEIEKRQRATTVYEVRVRMEDGTRRTITQSQPVRSGQRVRVEGDRVVPV